jgi:hypothetical protein
MAAALVLRETGRVYVSVCVCVCVCVRACVRACVRVCVCVSISPLFLSPHGTPQVPLSGVLQHRQRNPNPIPHPPPPSIPQLLRPISLKQNLEGSSIRRRTSGVAQGFRVQGLRFRGKPGGGPPYGGGPPGPPCPERKKKITHTCLSRVLLYRDLGFSIPLSKP